MINVPCSNHRPISHRFRDKRRCTSKVANFPTPRVFNAPMKGFPVEFGIGVRGPKYLNDGPTRWSKKFSDRFSRFDTIPAVTDTHPASQPPSHVAVAITLNALAKASSLKMNRSNNKLSFYFLLSFSLHFNDHFPGEHELAGVY